MLYFSFRDRLRASSLKIKFVTNTTKESKQSLHERLTRIGFEIDQDEIFTSLTAARKFVEKKNARPFLILSEDAKRDFEGINVCQMHTLRSYTSHPKRLQFSLVNLPFNPSPFFHVKHPQSLVSYLQGSSSHVEDTQVAVSTLSKLHLIVI